MEIYVDIKFHGFINSGVLLKMKNDLFSYTYGKKKSFFHLLTSFLNIYLRFLLHNVFISF